MMNDRIRAVIVCCWSSAMGGSPFAPPSAGRSSFILHPSSFPRRGFSVVELMIVLTVIGILISFSAPGFHRSIQQSHADIAGANLRAIWSAERLYWLEYRTYTDDLSELQSLGLIDPTIVSAAEPYKYSMVSADANTFIAKAVRKESTRWTGRFRIYEDGTMDGTVSAVGEPDVVPGFQ